MSEGFDVYVESAKRRAPYLLNYLDTGRRVKEAVLARYPEARVYIFGSVVRGRFTGGSDLDVLVVLGRGLSLEERAVLRAEVFKKLPDAPVELHVTDEKEFNEWYRRFIEPGELVEVLG